MKNLLFLLLFILGYAKTYEDITNKIHVVRVYDGDTFFINIDGYPSILGKRIGIRVKGIDTPKIRTKNKFEKTMAYKVREFVYNLLSNADSIVLKNCERGKYFRILADVYVDGVSLTKILLKKKYAYRYYGGTKKSWDYLKITNK